MSPDEYQQLAMRTKCPQEHALKLLDRVDYTDAGAQMLHAVLGLTGEAGELAGAIERYAYYQQPLDHTNIKEEIGDALWYLAELCSAFNWTMEEVMGANIKKLKTRFPDKFDYTLVAEENRNRKAEATAVQTDVMKRPPEADDLWQKMQLLAPPGEWESPVIFSSSWLAAKRQQLTDVLYDHFEIDTHQRLCIHNWDPPKKNTAFGCNQCGLSKRRFILFSNKLKFFLDSFADTVEVKRKQLLTVGILPPQADDGVTYVEDNDAKGEE